MLKRKINQGRTIEKCQGGSRIKLIILARAPEKVRSVTSPSCGVSRLGRKKQLV